MHGNSPGSDGLRGIRLAHMPMDAQKSLLVTDGPGGLDDLNAHLRRGWRVVSMAPMGGGGQSEGFAALVVIEPAGQAAEEVLAEIAEDMEDVLEGDGAPEDLTLDGPILPLPREDDDLGI